MRRGLGTDDKAKAEALVAQMNQLLQDEVWWTTAKHQEALQAFDQRIVDAFYDGIQAGIADSSEIRNSVVPLLGKAEGYARALFVGTTGAGKTSLLRHLIGSDPELDRFPSTSTAKTTISDIEVIPAAGEFRAAVAFFCRPSFRRMSKTACSTPALPSGTSCLRTRWRIAFCITRISDFA